MSACIIDQVEACFAAYNDLVARCTEESPLVAGQCLVDAVFSVYNNTRRLLATTPKDDATWHEAVTAPGEMGQCLESNWLLQCEAWINGISLIDPTDCPDATCYGATRSSTEHRMTGTAGTCSYSSDDGYSLAWNATSEQWDLHVDGVLCTSGSTDKGNPAGTYLLGTESIVVAPCASGICDISLDSAGGDEGYDQTFEAGFFEQTGGTIYVREFETYTQRDQLRIFSNGSEAAIYDSGCIATNRNPITNLAVTIPVGTTTLRVQVIPNCEGGSGTAWVLKIGCTEMRAMMRVARRSVETPARPEDIAEATRRFEICKACGDTIEGGFGCRHYRGCCFGARRAELGFRCPSGKW